MDYKISRKDIGLSICTLGTGLSYSYRHWDASKEKPISIFAKWGHCGIALVEACPIIGGFIALIEKIVHLIFSFIARKFESLNSQPPNFPENLSSKPFYETNVDTFTIKQYLEQVTLTGGTVSVTKNSSTVSCNIHW